MKYLLILLLNFSSYSLTVKEFYQFKAFDRMQKKHREDKLKGKGNTFLGELKIEEKDGKTEYKTWITNCKYVKLEYVKEEHGLVKNGDLIELKFKDACSVAQWKKK